MRARTAESSGVRSRGWSMLLLAVLLHPIPIRGQAVERLGTEISSFLQTYRWPDAHWGVMVTSLDRGDTLFSIGADSALAPASNAKLLTTSAALRLLGPDFRFRTYLLTDGTVRTGTLVGDLTLYGTGDPGISDRFSRDRNAVFKALADQLGASGIRTVSGDLIADASHLPGPLRPPSWDPADLNDAFAPGVSALSFNENVLSFRVVPATRSGRPPEVLTIPEHTGVEAINQALTVTGRARPRLAILRESPLDPIFVEGRISRESRDVWRQMTVPNPAHFAASAFRAVLEERGIMVEGAIRVIDSPVRSVVGKISAPSIQRPRTRILASYTSPPLREYLAVINKKSNNLFAELVFRTLGRTHSGQGTAAASARAVAEALSDIGVPMDGVRQLDGSGLSGENRVRPSTFVALLHAMESTESWPEFWASLPEAGRRRELGRMYRTAAAGNLRAKTGTIEGVSALSGVVRSRDQERLAFSILLNGAPSTTAAKRVENLIGARLADFSRGPNDRASTVVARTPPPRSTPTDRYRIRSGENLSGIALRHGTTVDAILRANPRVEANHILAGQWLTLPQKGGG